MLAITPQHRLFICVAHCDFRKGMDSLIGYCESVLKEDPFSGMIFAFRNRIGTGVKLLVYDSTGFWLCHKRFSSGKLLWWPSSFEEAKAISSFRLLSMLNQSQITYEASAWRALSSSNNANVSLNSQGNQSSGLARTYS